VIVNRCHLEGPFVMKALEKLSGVVNVTRV
jgi:hypothetical protein